MVSPLHLCVVEVGIEVGHVILEVLVRVVVDEVDQHRTHGPSQHFLHSLYGHVFEFLEFLLGEVLHRHCFHQGHDGVDHVDAQSAQLCHLRSVEVGIRHRSWPAIRFVECHIGSEVSASRKVCHMSCGNILQSGIACCLSISTSPH